jgi:transcriptional regulator with XRE-family HTH domain
MNPIAVNIRSLRDSRQWTQEELAAAAGVDTRTVQRAESGRPLAIESLRAIAAAFDTTPEALSVSPEEIQRVIDNFLATHTAINLTTIERAPQLEPLLAAADAWYFHKIGLTSDVQEDAAAAIEQNLRDWGEIWNEIGPAERRDACRHLQTLLESTWSAGLAVAAGTAVRRMRGAHAAPTLVFNILYVALTPASEPLRVLFQDTTMPLSFRG